jgi:lipoprotein-anchoring transpeptidase ErfK/SrfK
MSIRRPSRRVIVAGACALVLLLTGLVVWNNLAAGQPMASAQSERQRVVADLKLALARGFTSGDLRPVTARLRALDAAPTPPTTYALGRSDWYRQRAAQLARLRADLAARERQVLAQSSASSAGEIGAATHAIDRDRQLGADDLDLQPLQQRADEAAKSQAGAHSVTDFRGVERLALGVAGDANVLAAAVQQESDQIAQLGDGLKGQLGGNLDAIHKAGSDAVAAGRNDAAVAAYMDRSAPFVTNARIAREYARLEHYAGQVGAGDVDAAARAAAGAQRYSSQIHDALMTGLPAKTIIVSHEAQELWAYEDSKVVQSSLVTTGRPALPTDMGPMKVLSKSSPWTMRSPWPKGSPAWYPDTVVQMVLWFTNTGEGLHDAYWQGCCYGPGSEYSGVASHGCIHVPFNAERTLFNWADVGTPVIVYPGDGSPVSNQLAQMSTDNQGTPLSGP